MLGNIKNAKVINGEEAVTQHGMLVMDLYTSHKVKPQKRTADQKIKWWKLKTEETATRYRELVEKNLRGGQLETWEKVNEVIRNAGTECCGKTKGGKWKEKESWWWQEELRTVINEKKKRFKNWKKERTPQNEEAYRRSKQLANQKVAIAKSQATAALYENLKSKEGQKEIFKIARARNNKTKDNYEGYYIKNEQGDTLYSKEQNNERWATYYEKLLNESRQHVSPNSEKRNMEDITPIEEAEVEKHLSKMKNNKSVGPDGIPIEAFKVLGILGVKILTKIFNNILINGEMPEEWRRSTITPIYKGKGDHMNCASYRGIKLLNHTMKLWERIKNQRKGGGSRKSIWLPTGKIDDRPNIHNKIINGRMQRETAGTTLNIRRFRKGI